MKAFRDQVAERFRGVQDHICAFLDAENGTGFREDNWNYSKGDGGGRTRVYESGLLLEKGGVNFSAILGSSLPASAASGFRIPEGTPFFATGVSLVLHPHNPHAPTIHLNIRYFEAGDVYWFGGGVDLTPYYPEEAMVVSFHRSLKLFCERMKRDYGTYKKLCDEYFFNKHRNEPRGVGGLFFDHLRGPKEEELAFVEELGLLFPDLYRPFAALRDKPFTDAQRQFQLHRRSRYAEFNLVYDRGTLFGLQSGGRSESILMSLPPVCRWVYDFTPDPGSAEARLTDYFLKPRDWV
ncbi:MAG TPA: oxygen-dependent coproporphyrinogen oxidase [Fibrobacteres bacterium]|jgi:coproporphyrinogen III oxidase|nr:oxygen-dependent coproporphyrinogen oxidase [Fibrobacterota bacterium]